MKTMTIGLAALMSLALLTGCPQGEGEQTGTASPAATETAATGASPAAEGAASPATTAAVDASAIFSQKCAGCHGANGGGGMGPALQNVEAKGDEAIHDRIVNGSPDKGMPAFGSQLSDAEVDALVAYVKTL